MPPERPQRCNQIWFDPILRDRAAQFPSVSLRYRSRFDDFAEDGDGVIGDYTDLASGASRRLRASWLIACCGGRSLVRDRLGIAMDGDPVQGYPVDIFFRAERLWDRHDKGKAALYYLVGPTGQWGTLTELDGLTFEITTRYQRATNALQFACWSYGALPRVDGSPPS